MRKWDEIDNIKVDVNNDMLIQAFEYSCQHNIDTVEMKLEFNDGNEIMATITFSKAQESE